MVIVGTVEEKGKSQNPADYEKAISTTGTYKNLLHSVRVSLKKIKNLRKILRRFFFIHNSKKV